MLGKCDILRSDLSASLENLILDYWKSYPKLIFRIRCWKSYVARSNFHKKFLPKYQKRQQIRFHSTYHKKLSQKDGIRLKEKNAKLKSCYD